MIPFEYLTPRTLEEAIQLLDPEDPDIRPVGGGTAVMLMMKAGVLRPTRLVSLGKVQDTYRQIQVDSEGALRVGGMTTLAQLERSPLVQRGWPMLARTFKALSNIRVRNVATIGGNLAHCDPHMDMPPVLSALGARVVASGPAGAREIDVEQLCVGYYETVLARNEIISEVIVPPMRQARGAYFKVTTRAAHDWPALGVAVTLQAQGDLIRQARIVVAAATDRPTRLPALEQALRDTRFDEDGIRQAALAAARELDIASDQHGSAQYKKHLLGVYLGRAVRAALAERQGDGDHEQH
ncbi:xanthine dehydrogenase family protein subunit M [Orrella sp. JC864]|uniref:FAD binding domain-containing protein n=1 Tax=Orrella sp. JC864 TaxID=3120298 RepID=UPI00300B93EE